MAEMLENILGQLSKWGEVVVDKSGFYFRKAVDKGEELTKLGRLQLDIEKARRELKSHYAELGKWTFDQIEESNMTDLASAEAYISQSGVIRTLIKQIQELEVQKTEIKKREAEQKTESAEPEEPPVEEPEPEDLPIKDAPVE